MIAQKSGVFTLEVDYSGQRWQFGTFTDALLAARAADEALFVCTTFRPNRALCGGALRAELDPEDKGVLARLPCVGGSSWADKLSDLSAAVAAQAARKEALRPPRAAKSAFCEVKAARRVTKVVWTSTYQKRGFNAYLGVYDTELEAAAAVDKVWLALHGGAFSPNAAFDPRVGARVALVVLQDPAHRAIALWRSVFPPGGAAAWGTAGGFQTLIL